MQDLLIYEKELLEKAESRKKEQFVQQQELIFNQGTLAMIRSSAIDSHSRNIPFECRSGLKIDRIFEKVTSPTAAENVSAGQLLSVSSSTHEHAPRNEKQNEHLFGDDATVLGDNFPQVLRRSDRVRTCKIEGMYYHPSEVSADLAMLHTLRLKPSEASRYNSNRSNEESPEARCEYQQ